MAIPAAVIGALGALGAAARTLVLVSTETFSTNPAGKYSIRSGFPAVTWDSANSRLKITNENTQGIVAWDVFGNFSGRVAFEVDILFSADTANLKHFGMFCDSGYSGVNGYRFSSLGTAFNFSRWQGESETGIGTFTATSGITVGNTYTLRFERDGSNNWTASINGSQCPTVLNNSTYDAIRPGFFVYGSTVYVNELRVYQ